MRQVIALGGLLGLALIGSYLTWTAEEVEELGAEEVVVYTADPAGVSNISWKSEKLDVELRPGSDDKGEFVMVHVTERREKRKTPELKPPGTEDDDGHGHGEDETDDDETPEDGAEDPSEEPEEAPEVETIVTYFKGNDAATELLEGLAPLVALRELQLPADADPAVFGFDEPSATLEVNRKAGQVTLSVGGETYGSKDRYVKLDGRTFLVDDQTLRPLQYAKTRLLERGLQPLSEPDIEQVQVVAGEKTVTFTQQNADDRTKAFWADSTEPEAEHEVAGTWLGKVFKMRAREYVEPADLPELVPVFRYTVTGDGQTWNVEISKDAGDDKKFFAKADFLRSTVELTASLASDAVADLDSLFPAE